MKLIKISPTLFRVVSEGSTIEGNWGFIHPVLREAIDDSEIDFALADMASTGNDIADFGISGTFIASQNTRTVRYLLAELRAIQSLREEFNAAFRIDPQALDTRDAYTRLMNVYICLNVEAAIRLLEAGGELLVA